MSKRIALLMDKGWASDYAEFLRERSHQVHLLDNPQQILEFVKEGKLHDGDFDVVIVHAGFNIRTEEGWFDGADLCEEIRRGNPLVRIGVTGALPPYSEIEEEFKRAGADFYCHYTGLTSGWMRKQIEKGLKTPREIEMGKENFSTIPEWEVFKNWDENSDESREGDIYDDWIGDEGIKRGA